MFRLRHEKGVEAKVLTLMVSDLQRIVTSFVFIHDLWSSPVDTALATWLLWRQIGPSSLTVLALALGEPLTLASLQRSWLIQYTTSLCRRVDCGRETCRNPAGYMDGCNRATDCSYEEHARLHEGYQDDGSRPKDGGSHRKASRSRIYGVQEFPCFATLFHCHMCAPPLLVHIRCSDFV